MPCSRVSIVNFEHVIAGCVVFVFDEAEDQISTPNTPITPITDYIDKHIPTHRVKLTHPFAL